MSAAVYTITKGAVALDLLAGDYYIAAELPIGNSPRSFEILSGPGMDLPRISAYHTSDARVVPFTCEVTGDDGQTLEDNLDALYTVLPGPGETATITVGRSDGDYTGTITVLAIDGLECRYDYSRDMAAFALVTCNLLCDPWVYGATDTLYDASAVTLPCVLDLSAMLGDHAAPLALLLDATSANLHQVVAGVYPADAQPVSTFVREAVDLTWSGGAADVDANGWPDGVGNTLWKTNAAAGVSADIDVSDFIEGTYAIYANVKRDAACDPATIETTYTAPVDIEGTDLRRHFLGLVSLPCAKVRGAATSTLRVTLKGDDTEYVYVNTVEFIPCHAGLIGWHHGTAGSSADKLRWEDEVVYADDAASLGYSLADREIIAKGGTLVITGEATTEAPTLAVATTVTYAPRWEQLLSAGMGSGPGI